jgi:hypothetical protein
VCVSVLRQPTSSLPLGVTAWSGRLRSHGSWCCSCLRVSSEQPAACIQQHADAACGPLCGFGKTPQPLQRTSNPHTDRWCCSYLRASSICLSAAVTETGSAKARYPQRQSEPTGTYRTADSSARTAMEGLCRQLLEPVQAAAVAVCPSLLLLLLLQAWA